MTLIPESVSRMTRLMRSTLTCMAWNMGMARTMTRAMTTAISGITTSSRPDSGTSVWSARITPPTIRRGAEIMMVNARNTTICTCWTSFVLRVISDGGPK